MKQIDSPTASREGRVDAAIAEFLIAKQDGRPFDREQWLAKHAELAKELGDFLTDVEHVAAILEPLNGAAEETVTHAPHRGSSDATMEILSAVSLPSSNDDYEMLEQIAGGGMGVVFKARQKSLNRIVALKMLHGSRLSSPRDLDRFRQEAEAVAGLDHPNIVPIFEVGAIHGLPFFSMKLIGGGTLQHHKDRYLADPRLAAKLLVKVARAVHHAHQRGILHRDLKPSNILLDENGDPHVADFGLAKRIETESNAGGDNTQSGAIVGTLGYMAPEQARGQNQQLTTAVDVYGLGAILYELLTGQPPFRAKSTAETLLMIVSQEPRSPSALRPQVPRDLETICLKCLSKEPNKRYRNADELAQEIERWLNGESIQARAIGPVEKSLKWARRRPTAAALVVVCSFATLLLVGGLLRSNILISNALVDRSKALDEAKAAQAKTSDANIEMKRKLWQSLRDQARAGILSRRRGQRFESLNAIREAAQIGRDLNLPSSSADELRNVAIAALLLPDVRTAHQWNGLPEGTVTIGIDAKFQFYVRKDHAGQISLRNVTDDAEIAKLDGYPGSDGATWLSPDGRFVVDGHRGKSLRLWDVASDKPRMIPNDHIAITVSFTRDNRLIYAQPDGSIWRWELDPERSPLHIVTIPRCIGLAPDPLSERIACNVAPGIQLRDLRTGAMISQIAKNHVVDHGNMAWHPTANILAFFGADLRVHVWDVAADRELTVLEGMTSGGIVPRFVADGEVLVTAGWEGQIRFWDWRTGKQLLKMPGHIIDEPYRGNNRLPVYGTDGPAKTFVWHIESGREYRSVSLASKNDSGIAVWEPSIHPSGRILSQATSRGLELIDLAQVRKLTTLPVCRQNIKHHPSGAILANTQEGLLRQPLAFASGSKPRLTVGNRERLQHPGAHAGLDISNDGKVLATAIFSGAAVTVNNGESFAVDHGGDCRYVSVSPDGQWLATGSHSGKAARIWRVANREMVKELLPEISMMHVQFSPGGKWLATSGGGFRLWHVGTWEPGPYLGAAHSIAFNADDSLAAVETGTGQIRLLDPATGRDLARLDDPNQDVAHWLGFTPDGTKLIASSAVGRAIHIWDLRRIRTGLVDLGLDWDAPAYPPAPAEVEPAPIIVDRTAITAKP